MTDKVVRSKDVMDALLSAFELLKGQNLPVSEVGYHVYMKLLIVPEFYVTSTELRPTSELQPTDYKGQG